MPTLQVVIEGENGEEVAKTDEEIGNDETAKVNRLLTCILIDYLLMTKYVDTIQV